MWYDDTYRDVGVRSDAFVRAMAFLVDVRYASISSATRPSRTCNMTPQDALDKFLSNPEGQFALQDLIVHVMDRIDASLSGDDVALDTLELLVGAIESMGRVNLNKELLSAIQGKITSDMRRLETLAENEGCMEEFLRMEVALSHTVAVLGRSALLRYECETVARSMHHPEGSVFKKLHARSFDMDMNA